MSWKERCESGGGERWRLAGDSSAPDLKLCNDYLAYLADRNYSPAIVRAYAFDLLHFTRWLRTEGLRFKAVDTDALLRYLAACRMTRRSGQHDDVIPLASGRALGFAPSTINRRLAAISGLFSFLEMRHPSARERHLELTAPRLGQDAAPQARGMKWSSASDIVPFSPKRSRSLKSHGS